MLESSSYSLFIIVFFHLSAFCVFILFYFLNGYYCFLMCIKILYTWIKIQKEEFKYLGVKIDKEDRQENAIKNRINNGRAITAMLNSVLWNRHISRKNKLLIYNSVVKSTVTYSAEIGKFNKKLESKLISMEIDFLRKSVRCSRL